MARVRKEKFAHPKRHLAVGVLRYARVTFQGGGWGRWNTWVPFPLLLWWTFRLNDDQPALAARRTSTFVPEGVNQSKFQSSQSINAFLLLSFRSRTSRELKSITARPSASTGVPLTPTITSGVSCSTRRAISSKRKSSTVMPSSVTPSTAWPSTTSDGWWRRSGMISFLWK